MDRDHANERKRKKRRDAENAEQRKEMMFLIESLSSVSPADPPALRLSVSFAPLRSFHRLPESYGSG